MTPKVESKSAADRGRRLEREKREKRAVLLEQVERGALVCRVASAEEVERFRD